MKITDVKITPPLGRQNRNWALMKIFNDEGIVGVGESLSGAGRGGSQGLKRMLVGKDPMNINKLHDDQLMGMRGAGVGVEIALWDIKGKKLGVPMHQLLGGKIRDRIRMYCDCHAGDFWTSEDYARRWREVR